MAVKRRTIWMSDEDWAKLGEKASLRECSISAYLVAATVGGGFIVPESILPEMRRISRELIEKPNPYRSFTPVPKPGRGK